MTGALRRVPAIWLVLLIVTAVIIWRNPSFAEPLSLLTFLKRSAPLIVLTAGQLFVIVTGEFDLSAGALITACVVVAAKVSAGDPALTWPVIGLLALLGAGVGLVNGLVTTLLRVPSFITTLGMMLVLNGAVFLWTGGSPTGSLAPEFRQYGRETGYAVAVTAVVVAVAWLLLHRSRFGHLALATGGGTRAAALSGVPVARMRIIAFVISGLSAVVAAILLAGFAGLSKEAGAGYEFQAISAVVLGGAVLGGGRGTAGGAVAGALTLQCLFTLLNLLGLEKPLRDTVQGVLIILAAAFAAYRLRKEQ
ncbi:ABC transporter permease [Planotetraspora sp. A-T 1434]|uniref:ABC transporter permease n=1 Tax=Planotetraspora sp. A-T 1434 TaxID=2979219 RepID=UPI0021C0A8C9|nr:ABC transporter permease [Planotetraspora sp. A-T 1434]MCT9929290.1 ABC transporter permease [Planotetraspora sp. A-T 1434]